MEKIKSSLIITVLNEERSIRKLLQSIEQQTVYPHELIIVDACSQDNTVAILRDFAKNSSIRKKTRIYLFEKKGNRSVGRNYAAKKANGEILLITDAGCVLDHKWVERITQPFQSDPSVEVVAGFYKGQASSVFEQCIMPYILIMPDRVDPESFLPATRSMAIKRTTYHQAGGLPEHLHYSEDFFFARFLKKSGRRIVMAKDALVSWIPPQGIGKIYTMFYNFALGDMSARIVRPKVVLLFGRYIVGLVSLSIAIFFQISILQYMIIVGVLFYAVWAIRKNYRYVRNIKAVIYLPFLQFLSDTAVIHGTLKGVLIWGIHKMR